MSEVTPFFNSSHVYFFTVLHMILLQFACCSVYALIIKLTNNESAMLRSHQPGSRDLNANCLSWHCFTRIFCSSSNISSWASEANFSSSHLCIMRVARREWCEIRVYSWCHFCTFCVNAPLKCAASSFHYFACNVIALKIYFALLCERIISMDIKEDFFLFPHEISADMTWISVSLCDLDFSHHTTFYWAVKLF